MKKAKNKENLVKIPEAGLLALVAAKLKDVVLFQEKVEKAKKYLSNAKVKTA